MSRDDRADNTIVTDERPCTCHPDDNPPVPCQRKYALAECRERAARIDQLDRSFLILPNWVKAACKHGMGAPSHHPKTGEKFKSFREVIEAASDETLEILISDFEDNGDLLPQVPRQ